MSLADEIRIMQQELIALDEEKEDPLNDPEIYEKSCKIDEMIVELIKQNSSK